jgi:hypothetical protein
MIGQGDMIDCPPVTEVPASLAQSLNPSIINEVETDLSSSFMSRQTPNTIRIVETLVTPIAYKSLRTLQQAILP